MRSVILMIIKNIRKKRLQTILISIIILTSAMIFSTSLGVLWNINEPFKVMYKKLNASHDLISFDKKNYDIDKIQSWWNSQADVTGTRAFRQYHYNGKAIINNKSISNELIITEALKEEAKQDKLQVVEGKKVVCPADGEVWIPTGLAYENKLKVGDDLIISVGANKISLKISAIVVDPEFSSSMINPSRVWVAPGEIKAIFNDEDSVNYSLGIRYKDYAKSDTLMKQFEDYLGGTFIGNNFKYSFIEYVYTMQYKIVADILLVFAIIIMVVTLFIISFTIKNGVLSDYKTIGILKSQGFSNNNILWTYTGQFLVMALLAVPIGIILSLFLVKKILFELIKTIGTGNIDFIIIMPSAITFSVLIIIVTIASYITSIKAAHIKPAEAIRYGAPSKDFRKKAFLNVSDLKLFSMEIVLAIKQLLSSKRQSLFMLFAMITTIFVIIFMTNVNNALIHLSDNTAYWGNDNSEILISRLIEKNGLSNEQLVKELKQHKSIKDIVPWYYLENSIIKKDEDSVSQKITGFIYDGDMNSIGVLNIKGRNPIASNEVSLALNTSRINKKEVGDYIDILINGKKKTFLVTGVYQTINNGAEGFRAQMSAVKDLSEDLQLALYCVNLKPKVSQESFMRDTKNKYGDKIDVKKTSEVVNNLSGAIGNGMTIPIYFIALTFAVVSFITIFNTILINIYEEKKNYGIFKALGISAFQIRRAIVYRVMFLFAMSLVIGVPLGIMLPSKIVGALLSSSGMLEIPITVTKLGIAIALIGCTILVFIASFIPASKIFNINSRQLIEE